MRRSATILAAASLLLLTMVAPTRANELLRTQSHTEAVSLLEQKQAMTSDIELTQYALLTQGEINTVYLRQPEEAIKPLRKLTMEYLPSSPYVQKAHYYLGSIYVEMGKAPQAFKHLKAINENSPDYQDALVKLDWAAKNLRNVIELPFGFEIGGPTLGSLAILLDLVFVLLWISQSVFSAAKTRWMWLILVIVLLGKLASSYYLQKIAAVYA